MSVYNGVNTTSGIADNRWCQVTISAHGIAWGTANVWTRMYLAPDGALIINHDDTDDGTGAKLQVNGSASFANGAFIGGTASHNRLAVYEESLPWTPVPSAASGAFGSTSCSGRYTRVGNMVHAEFSVTILDIGSAVGYVHIGGLPYAGTGDAVHRHLGVGREDTSPDIS